MRVLDIAVRDGAPYIVFEYVGELSLQGMINNMGLLPPLRIAQIGAQVSAALEAAAKSGLLHRDVKPDNRQFRRSRATSDSLDATLPAGNGPASGSEPTTGWTKRAYLRRCGSWYSTASDATAL